MPDQANHVSLAVADGTETRAYVARPSGPGPHRAMLVLQEALGVNSKIRGVADRYAKQGYVAIAPELFHRTNPGYEAAIIEMDQIMPLVRSLTTDGLTADAAAKRFVNVEFSDANHAFFNEQVDRYDRAAANQSWA
jgi:carboxymethylenebutenolidase